MDRAASSPDSLLYIRAALLNKRTLLPGYYPRIRFTGVKNLVMAIFSAEVELVLDRLARLPQVRCAFVDPFIFPSGYSEQCRVYRNGTEWEIEFVKERHGKLADFFDGMDVKIVHQAGFQIVQGRNRYNGLREVGPNVQGWYNREQWAFVERELRARSQ